MYKEVQLIKILLKGHRQKYLKMINLNLASPPHPDSWWLSYRNTAWGTNPGERKTSDNHKVTRAWCQDQTGQAGRMYMPPPFSSQGPQKQSCYKTVFEKRFFWPGGSTETIPFHPNKKAVTLPSPPSKYEYTCERDAHTHKHTRKALAINYFRLSQRAITLLNIFHHHQNSSRDVLF